MKNTKTNEPKETVLNTGIKSGDRFYLIGTSDRLRRSYTVLKVTKAYSHTNGIETTTNNVTARNEDTGKEIVFNLSHLIGINAKIIEVK